jgi:hypothetical protein
LWWQQQYLVWVIVTTILFMLALPVDASAKPGYKVHPGGMKVTLPVRKNANHVISASANVQQRVQFVVEGPSSATEYSTRGRVNSRHVVASFGSLGRLDVRLRFTRHSTDPPHRGRCRGRGTRYQEGTYRGTLEFSHSVDVPAVSITQGRVYLERRFRRVCKRQRRQSKPSGTINPKHKIEASFLTADGKGGGRTVLLEALSFALKRNLARSVGRLAATVYERRTEVRIARRINVPIDNDSFTVSVRGKHPETVEIQPPTPFAGGALYSRSRGISPSWTGDLSVDLPGMGRIPLTGPGFSAAFCRGATLTRLERCPYASSFTSSVGIGLQLVP